MDELADIDRRPSLFVGLTQENLARHVATFSRTEATPPTVASVLADARRTFVGAAVCYDNFASAAFKALQAAELALRVLMDETQSRAALGQLLRRPKSETVLNPTQVAWFREFALHSRNTPSSCPSRGACGEHAGSETRGCGGIQGSMTGPAGHTEKVA